MNNSNKDNKMNNKWILSSAFLISFTSFANQEVHTIGVGIGAGDYGVRDTSIGNTHIFYSYQFLDSWKAELNYSSVDTVIDLDSLSINVKREFSLSKRNELYIKGGAAFYDYNVSKGDLANLANDGAGITASAGWQYSFQNNLGVYAEYTYIDLGDIDSITLNIGVSFSF
jgi:opacity protein-like surface antigen